MRSGWIYWILTEKRLFQKISYISVLLLVLLITIGMRIAARQEAGMVTIGLCCEEKGGLSEEIIQGMLAEKGVLRFLTYSAQGEALQAVESGEVKAVWIFPERLDEKISEMAAKGRISPVISVVEREDDISLVFTREVLCSYVFPSLVYETYRDFVRKNLEEDVSDEMLEQFYQESLVRGNLFEARYLDGSVPQQDSYLTAPVQGLLSIWLVIAGIAAVLFYKRDVLDGVYDAVPMKKRVRYEMGLLGVVLVNGGVVYSLSCHFLGVLYHVTYEWICLLVYLVCVACFCMLLGEVLPRQGQLGGIMPLLVIAMALFCPVFLEVRLPWQIQGILPPYFYLKSIHNVRYLYFMFAYVLAGLVLYACIRIVRKIDGKE